MASSGWRVQDSGVYIYILCLVFHSAPLTLITPVFHGWLKSQNSHFVLLNPDNGKTILFAALSYRAVCGIIDMPKLWSLVCQASSFYLQNVTRGIFSLCACLPAAAVSAGTPQPPMLLVQGGCRGRGPSTGREDAKAERMGIMEVLRHQHTTVITPLG